MLGKGAMNQQRCGVFKGCHFCSLSPSATKANQVWRRRVTLEKAFAQGTYSVGLLSALPTKWTRKAGTRSSQWAESNIQFHL